jgi:hypothetical protein
VRALHRLFCDIAVHREVENKDEAPKRDHDGTHSMKSLIGTLAAPLDLGGKHGPKDEASMQKVKKSLV